MERKRERERERREGKRERERKREKLPYQQNSVKYSISYTRIKWAAFFLVVMESGRRGAEFETVPAKVRHLYLSLWKTSVKENQQRFFSTYLFIHE